MVCGISYKEISRLGHSFTTVAFVDMEYKIANELKILDLLRQISWTIIK